MRNVRFVTIFLAAAAVSLFAKTELEADTASAEQTAIKKLQQTFHQVLNKGGVHIGGEFRSEFMNSRAGGVEIDTIPIDEVVAYTAADFDITARPHSAAQGRLVFRLHSDWRNLWDAARNSIFTRWLSIDGIVGDGVFRYNVGDFQQKYTPLTLYTPEIEILYEPTIFALDRQMAMDEFFLGENKRTLQGANANFDARLTRNGQEFTLLNEVHIGAFGTRLRHQQMEETDMILPIEADPKEKYATGANLDFRTFKGITLGGSYVNIWDAKSERDGSPSLITAERDAPLDSLQSLYSRQRTSIISGRAGLKLDQLLNAEDWRLSFSGEFAQSDNNPEMLTDSLVFGSKFSVIFDTVLIDTLPVSNKASALNTQLSGGITLGTFANIGLDINWIRNEKAFQNELAQSPSFTGMRIMNYEIDSLPQGATYSTFDALYRHVFRFVRQTVNAEDAQDVPQTKSSYSKAVYTQHELHSIAKLMDPSVQLVLPFGPATPNRTGIKSKLQAELLEKAVEITGVFSSMEELTEREAGQYIVNADGTVDTGITSIKPHAYNEMGGGAKINIDEFIDWKFPIHISGSFVASSAKRDPVEGVIGSERVSSTFLNLGGYFRFLKRWALLAGFQAIQTDYTNVKLSVAQAPLAESSISQQQIGGGLEYRISNGAYLMGKVQKISLSFSENYGYDDFNQTLFYLGLRIQL